MAKHFARKIEIKKGSRGSKANQSGVREWGERWGGGGMGLTAYRAPQPEPAVGVGAAPAGRETQRRAAPARAPRRDRAWVGEEDTTPSSFGPAQLAIATTEFLFYFLLKKRVLFYSITFRYGGIVCFLINRKKISVCLRGQVTEILQIFSVSTPPLLPFRRPTSSMPKRLLPLWCFLPLCCLS